MLIGIDASRAAVPQRTGTEVYSLHLIRNLIELGSKHRFRLYFNTPPLPGLIPSAPHCEQCVMPFPRLWTHLRLSVEMWVRPPDVLLVPSHVLPLIHPRRSVVTVHDLGHRHYPQAHTFGQRYYLEWGTHYHVRTAAHILTDSEATKDDLMLMYNAEPARVSVAYLGVDPGMHPVHNPETLARVQHKYGVRSPYLLYVGTLQPRKNLVRLVEAFGKISAWEAGGEAPLQLVLAGKKGWLYEEIGTRIRALGLEEQVAVTGFVDDADLPALYSGARLFVMPSLHEGFCLPILEAMACGTPVVCSNTSSLPEVAGQAALLFDPHDAGSMADTIARAAANRALCRTLVAQGFEQVRSFTWDRCARQVLNVLERIGGAP